LNLRKPAVAGTFYPADPGELGEAIRASYLHRLGPGKIPVQGGSGESRGLGAFVCPHAGYAYSGPVAAHSYLVASRLKGPCLVVAIGPNHYGLGSGVAAYGEGEWETPIGRVSIDGEATAKLAKTTGIVDVDPSAHRLEHSVEVQLPFLQAIYGASFTFLPVVLAFQDKDTARALGRGVAELLKDASEGRRNAILIASSDLTHYEPASQAREKDGALLKHVEALDVDAFYTTLERRDITACGFGAIAAVMEACRLLGYRRGSLNAYATSGDTTGDNSAVVGYPSVTFER